MFSLLVSVNMFFLSVHGIIMKRYDSLSIIISVLSSAQLSSVQLTLLLFITVYILICLFSNCYSSIYLVINHSVSGITCFSSIIIDGLISEIKNDIATAEKLLDNEKFMQYSEHLLQNVYKNNDFQ